MTIGFCDCNQGRLPCTCKTNCRDCKHRATPGRVYGYCNGGREDLPLAYGENHPLRKLPDDFGARCDKFEPFD